jgi:hypothetical protein
MYQVLSHLQSLGALGPTLAMAHSWSHAEKITTERWDYILLSRSYSLGALKLSLPTLAQFALRMGGNMNFLK